MAQSPTVKSRAPAAVKPSDFAFNEQDFSQYLSHMSVSSPILPELYTTCHTYILLQRIVVVTVVAAALVVVVMVMVMVAVAVAVAVAVGTA